ncbi:MAG: hypothetical protein B6U78_01415 [Candidatus Aenigmarchaeota archaeon ex4484_224]|nr:MAG: hypothetical protein B6U78_01415 [Candidatus Aenigmarchaeota archaeon ex4484_224]
MSLILDKILVCLIIVVIVLLITGNTFYKSQIQTSKRFREIGIAKKTIKTEVKGLVVYYRRETVWNKDSFLRILKNKDEFSSNLTNEFISIVSNYGVEVVNPTIVFSISNSSTVFTCEIHGSVSKSGDQYYATFEWLIKPLGLDFIDNHFNESVYGLSWKGVINGVPTEIICRFPYTGLPYSAWGQPTGHCHAHVWWKV